MAKTTIDGLKKRSEERPVVPRSQKVQKPKPRQIGATRQNADPLLQKTSGRKTPKKHDTATASVGSFIEQNESDWSELLTAMGASETPHDFPETEPDGSLADEMPRRTYEDELDTDDDWMNQWGEGDELADEAEREKLLESFGTNEDLPRSPRKKNHRKKKIHAGRIVAIIVVLALVMGGLAVFFWGDGLISRLTGGKSGFWDTISALVSTTVPFDTDGNGRTNVLVFGTGGYDMDGTNGDTTHDGSQLTDSIMVISFNQNTKDVALVSLPRDLRAPMACASGKINEVYWCNNQNSDNEDAGARALMTQVGQILGLEIQYYAHVNWRSLVDIVDALGGITVTLDEDIADYGWTNAVATAGVPMTVNGEMALALARARHGTLGGDFTRGKTQQKIVAAIVDKVVHSGQISLTAAFDILNILGDNLRTNFSSDNVKAGVVLAADMDADKIRQVPLVDYDKNIFYVTTATIGGLSFVVPQAGTDDFSEIQEYVARMFSDDPVQREGASIAVFNASGEYGVASAERNALEADGYKVTSIGDAEEWTCDAKYCIFMMNDQMPTTATRLAEKYGVEPQNTENLPEGVWADNADVIIILREPTASL